MREAVLYRPIGRSGRLQCDVCGWRCHIGVGLLGRCKSRVNNDGTLYSLIYGQVSAAHVDPIEKKPLFHFHPGSQVFSLGSYGCNFRCVHCQNWEIAYAEPGDSGDEWQSLGRDTVRGESISPEQAVYIAQRQGCEGICWTYNEPTVWFEYTLDCARLAKERGLYTAYVTNGYISREALDTIAPFLDAFRVDVKGFNDRCYRRLAKVPRWREVLDVTLRARQRWGMHVEVVTNVIPTLNDDEQLQQIAEWIRDALGPDTPWHVTAFHPDALLMDVPATPRSTLNRARQAGLDAGLRFVYTGNVRDTGGEHTHCPSCGTVAIERAGYQTRVVRVAEGGRCGHCGTDLNMRGF